MRAPLTEHFQSCYHKSEICSAVSKQIAILELTACCCRFRKSVADASAALTARAASETVC